MSFNLKNASEDCSRDLVALSGAQAARFDKLKFIFLSVIFFFVIAAYTIIRNLKSSIFMGLVGKEYVPLAKLVVLLFLVPAILFYSKLVDKVRRYYLLSFYSIFYAIGCLFFAFFVGHKTIGIENTDQSPYRLLGWFFYVFAEGFSPFVLSVFWAFSNSISKPDGAKENYGMMTSASKVGGIFTAVLAWALFSISDFSFFGKISDVSKIRIIFVVASICLIAVSVTIMYLIKIIPSKYLHGYEAVYKEEERMDKAGHSDTGIFAGLKMFFKYPYVLGIFSMIFFYEVLDTILGYLRLGIAEKAGGTIAGTSAFMFGWEIVMHSVGLIISFFGTTALLRKLGTRTCVFLIPIMMGSVVLCFVFTNNATIAMIALTFIKSLHYAFDKPIVESLYIPTLKEIKFKSKSWIDAFGSKVAKGTGSVFNLFSSFLQAGAAFSFVFAIIIGAWATSSFFLGKRFDKAIETNEAIGADSND